MGKKGKKALKTGIISPNFPQFSPTPGEIPERFKRPRTDLQKRSRKDSPTRRNTSTLPSHFPHTIGPVSCNAFWTVTSELLSAICSYVLPWGHWVKP